MSFEADEEILQDFLIEAGEILELLSEHLVELENDPHNAELLNAIFRGFHTVKGGAGFLALNELVEVCHGAENVFDILRTGKRHVDADLMDVILQALDNVNSMFASVQNREPLEPADPALIEQLHILSSPADEAEGHDSESEEEDDSLTENEEVDETVESEESESTSSEGDDISEDEFERLLDELHGSKAPLNSPAEPEVKSETSDSSDISDDEFESLLDELHGKGAFSAKSEDDSAAQPSPDLVLPEGDDIDEDDFEALLDQLHGKGQAPKKATASEPAKEAPKSAEKPVDKPVVNPAVKPVEKSAPAAKKEPAKAEAKPAAKSAAPSKPAPRAAEQKPLKPVAPAVPPAPAPETTVRVDTKRLDQIMNMVGELVLVRNRLTSLGLIKDDEELSKVVTNLDGVTTDLQGAVMQTRMQPIKKVFGRFPRVVRDLARTLKKEIALILEGEETDLDKNLVEALADPLVHLVRNSVDHGIEAPSVREAKGKPKEGTIVLSASQQGDHILLTIKDDGAGMDPEKLKNIAISRGVLDAESAARMTDKDAFSLIFAPGFSTKEVISEVSGRGVGMDVVKTKIAQLNGTVNIDSELGIGTILEIKVPLTLAILPTLMVVIGKQTFAFPLAGVNEIFHLDLTKTNVVDGQLTVIVREKAIPLFYLDKWLIRNFEAPVRESGHVVIVQIGTKKVGFVVDSLIGQEEVVIKPLDQLLHGTPGMSGATITSDGGIALILDVPNLLKYYAKKSQINQKFH